MNDTLADWMQRDLGAGLTPLNVGLALATTLAVYLVLTLCLRFTLGRAARMAQRSSLRADDMLIDVLSGTNRWLILLVALLAGLGMLDLPERWHARVDQLWFVALALQAALWLNRAVTLFVIRYRARYDTAGTPQVGASATLMSWGLRTLVWTVLLLSVLANMGVNITAFVASLGIGGVAIALAVQNILGDLFASLSIAVDKPFEVGHFIIFGDVLGTVTYVGLKTTRIQALSGQRIIISNAELLKQTINNYQFMAERRVVFTFGVSYDTTAEQVPQISALVQRIIEGIDQTRFDRAHMKGFSPSSMDYEVVYYVLDPSYNIYMDIQQAINVQLMRALDEMGVSFAWPRRAVHVMPQALGTDVAPAVADDAARSPAQAPAPLARRA